jgi:hypothetical protein
MDHVFARGEGLLGIEFELGVFRDSVLCQELSGV